MPTGHGFGSRALLRHDLSIGIPAYRHTPPLSAILCPLSRALAVGPEPDYCDHSGFLGTLLHSKILRHSTGLAAALE